MRCPVPLVLLAACSSPADGLDALNHNVIDEMSSDGDLDAATLPVPSAFEPR